MEKKFKLSSTIHCDVLIIGAGGAGLRCAAHILEKRPGTHIIAVTKVSHPQKSHTSTAQGGLAAVDPHDAVDKPIYHMFDTWKGSDCMADQDVVRRSSMRPGRKLFGWRIRGCTSPGTKKGG